ncbi:DNA-formamidopyrimidine glycosylase [Ammoniphilus oxalaticus]|uniref:Formamidopyrimidine-DNA glycosylase n=1 Tax=Ammoniphilus oxalaticus TaxID=66863 RepID=A0A419SIL2_9BACL|nr:DNA-formamidopyrimidine glycosylase [Ammoniphilus oxalaticus]RKD23792.1 DNA-formamidopyrimidine glycosylase [Ammoniphilus oxalaticus]
MPELPEVETVKRTLQTLVCGKKIERVTVSLPRIARSPSDLMQFCSLLEGETIQDVERRGKFLKVIMDEIVLVSHLRMEGRYGVYQANEPLEKHTHVIFHFTDGTELRYRDVRQFGTMDVLLKGEVDHFPSLAKLGPEPLADEFTLSQFRTLMKGRSGKIKPLLLNQEFIVGLGNIYVDEALYAARIHPETAADQLSANKLAELYQAIRDTLQAAVEQGGSSIKSYVNGQGEMGMFQQQLQAYGRNGEPCSRCGNTLERTVVAGRGTHFCPRCQKQMK